MVRVTKINSYAKILLSYKNTKLQNDYLRYDLETSSLETYKSRVDKENISYSIRHGSYGNELHDLKNLPRL